MLEKQIAIYLDILGYNDECIYILSHHTVYGDVVSITYYPKGVASFYRTFKTKAELLALSREQKIKSIFYDV